MRKIKKKKDFKYIYFLALFIFNTYIKFNEFNYNFELKLLL